MSTTTTQDIFDTINSTNSLSTLFKAINASGLADTLKGTGRFTIFAPTDEAFEQIPKSTLEAVLEDADKLQSCLKNHVVAGKQMLCDISCTDTVQSLEGQDLRVSTKAGCKINNACVCQADIECSNGVIHIIDRVLLPE